MSLKVRPSGPHLLNLDLWGHILCDVRALFLLFRRMTLHLLLPLVESRIVPCIIPRHHKVLERFIID